MGDISGVEATEAVRLVGSTAEGIEESPIGSSTDREVFIRDTHNNGGLDIVIPLTIAPIEGKVELTRRINRKYVIMEALDTNIVWGFTSTTQSFDLFKSQLIMVPIGEDTEIWFKMKVGTGSIAFAELS